MTSNISKTRRTMLKTMGASLSVALVAGCLGDDGDGATDENGDGATDENGDTTNNIDTGSDGIEIEAGTKIVFEGSVQHWEGLEPESIAGEENPTIILEEGAEYTMEWINADGAVHDLQIWDESGDSVGDLATDSLSSEGDSDSLTFTAESEMVTYVCSYHSSTQIGELIVE